MLPDPPARTVAEVVPVTWNAPRLIAPLLLAAVAAWVLSETIGAVTLPARVILAVPLVALLLSASNWNVAPLPVMFTAFSVSAPLVMYFKNAPEFAPEPPALAVRFNAAFCMMIGLTVVPSDPMFPLGEFKLMDGLLMFVVVPAAVMFPVPPVARVMEELPRSALAILAKEIDPPAEPTVLNEIFGTLMAPVVVMPVLPLPLASSE